MTRVVFGPADMKARAWLIDLCEKAGLSVRQDAIGNTFARWQGSDPHAPAVGTGSHIDAIPNAGKYDGVVGVLGGLEAIRSLQESGFRPRHSIELLVFTSEEPTRFGIGCLGSRLLVRNAFTGIRAEVDRQGWALARRGTQQRGRAWGSSGGELPGGYYKAFVELHIEQGPLLEREGTPLGIVTKIAAPASFRVIVEGSGGHAGALLMPDRRDALCAAAEVILAIESAARASGALDTVATVGICDVFPGAINSVPSRVTLGVDVRDTDQARRDEVLRKVSEACDEISKTRQAPIRIEPLNADAPATCAPGSRRSALEILRRSQSEVHADDQPRLPRLALHVARGPHRHAVHPLPQGLQPPPRRIRQPRAHLPRHPGPRRNPGVTVRLDRLRKTSVFRGSELQLRHKAKHSTGL